MADKIYLGKNARSFRSSPRFRNYDMVILNIDENNYVSSPHVTLDGTKWESRSNGEHVFTYNGSRWVYNGSTYTTAALSSTFGITVTYSSVTAAKTGDTVTVSKITNNDEQTVTAVLTRSGRAFEVDCPLVKPSQRQDVADALLAKVYGFSYQPYEADGALLNPAAELGDAITAFGVYGGLYKQNLTFGRLMVSSIGAPAEEEIDSEFQFKSSQERRYARKFADIAAEFKIQADEISAKVSKVGSNSTQSFSWQLQEDHFSVFSGSNEMLRIDSTGSTFAGVVKANQIMVGNTVIGGSICGYIQGSQIGSRTISGGFFGNIAPSTISTANTVTGINTSLNYADKANNVLFNGTQVATYIKATYATLNQLTVGSYDTRWSYIKCGDNISRWLLTRDNS